MIREQISKIIASNYSPDEKSLMILLYLEYNCSLNLNGNGWLDEDEVAQEAFGEDSRDILGKMRTLLK